MTNSSLAHAVEKFSALAHSFSDLNLERDWVWGAYDEGVRFVFSECMRTCVSWRRVWQQDDPRMDQRRRPRSTSWRSTTPHSGICRLFCWGLPGRMLCENPEMRNGR